VNERDAIARMKRGDVSGLSAIVEAYQLKAVRTATLITRNRALAEDVVQATFIRIYKKIHQFDSSRPFAPWFMRSVTNAAIQAAKKQERSLSLDNEVNESTTFEDLLMDEDASPAQQMEDKEQRELIREALDALSPEQRAAVVMRYYLDMSERDMADELDTPTGTIKWRLHQARKRLKGLLQGIMPAGEVKNG